MRCRCNTVNVLPNTHKWQPVTLGWVMGCFCDCKVWFISFCCYCSAVYITTIYQTALKHIQCTVYPKKYAHGFCFAVLCCGYTLTDFPISIRLTSLALWQSNDCPSASKATLMNMDKYFMWIHYERLHNHKKSKAQQNRAHISWDILYITTIYQTALKQPPTVYTHITMTSEWPRWRLKSPASRLFTQSFIQA